MPYLTAAIVLVGCLGLVDLVLTFGVVRRLRNHTALIEHLLARGTDRKSMLRVGERIGPFSAVTTSGDLITRESLTGTAPAVLVGFFSPDCEGCRDRLPGFVRKAEESGEALAVVSGQEAAAIDLVDSFALQEVAHVVLESPDKAPVSAAFGVRSFPAVCVVDKAGVVLSHDADQHAPTAAGTSGPNGAATAEHR